MNQPRTAGRRMHPADWALARIVLAAFVLGTAGCQPTTRVAGDATVVDHGWLSWYPRVTVTAPSVQVRQGGAQVFRLSGLPKAKYEFFLVVRPTTGVGLTQERWAKVWNWLSDAQVVAAVTLRDDREGLEIREYGAPLAGGWYQGTSGPGGLGFSNEKMAGIELAADVRLEIELTGNLDRVPEEVWLTPVLRGGGIRE